MSPATNGKSTVSSSGVKRRASSTPSNTKKRVKKGTSTKSKISKQNGEVHAPEDIVTKPDGWEDMSLYKSFLRITFVI